MLEIHPIRPERDTYVVAAQFAVLILVDLLCLGVLSCAARFGPRACE